MLSVWYRAPPPPSSQAQRLRNERSAAAAVDGIISGRPYSASVSHQYTVSGATSAQWRPTGQCSGTCVISDPQLLIVDQLETNMLLFSDDSKLIKHVSVRTAQEDCTTIQQVLNRLVSWSSVWLLRFYPYKCHLLSLGRFMVAPCRASVVTACITCWRRETWGSLWTTTWPLSRTSR